MDENIVDLTEARRRKQIDEFLKAAKHYRFPGIDLRVAAIPTHITGFGKSGDKPEHDVVRFIFYDITDPENSSTFGALDVTREQLSKMKELADGLLDFRDESGNIV